MSPLEAKVLLAVILLLAPTTLRSKHAAIAKKDEDKPTTTQRRITLQNCPDKCGSISIPYPFGIKAGCFRSGFEVVCNDTFNPPRPFIANPTLDNKTRPLVTIYDNYCLSSSTGCLGREITSKSLVEIIEISTDKAQARVYAAFSFACNTSRTGDWARRQQIDAPAASPFVISQASNVLVGIGRAVSVQLDGAMDGTAYGVLAPSCRSRVMLPAVPVDGSCATVGCCQSPDLPPNIHCSRVETRLDPIAGQKGSPCSYGMLVERSWYKFSVADLDNDDVFRRNNPRGVPVVLDFAVRSNTAGSSFAAIRSTGSSCPAAGQPVPQGYACVSGNSSCVNAVNGRPGYVCKCWDGFHGNPWIPSGCQGTSALL